MIMLSISVGDFIIFAYLISSGIADDLPSSKRDESKSTKRGLDADTTPNQEIPQTSQRQTKKKSSAELVTITQPELKHHKNKNEKDSLSGNSDYNENNKYSDKYDKISADKLHHIEKQVKSLKEFEKKSKKLGKPVKLAPEDHSLFDNNNFKKIEKKSKNLPKYAKSASEDYSSSDYNDSSGLVYLDDESNESRSRKLRNKQKKTEKTMKEKKEKKKKERKCLLKKKRIGSNLNSNKHWEKRLVKEERRKAWMEVHNLTYINKTRIHEELLSSSEHWERILAKEERSKLWMEANNLTYVNKSIFWLESFQRRRLERNEREKNRGLRKKEQQYKDKAKWRKEKEIQFDRSRTITQTDSQEAFRQALDGSTSEDHKEGSRRSRARARDAEQDRRGGGFGRRNDDHRGGDCRENDRYRPSRYDNRDNRGRDDRGRNDRYKDSRYDRNNCQNYRDNRYSNQRNRNNDQSERRPYQRDDRNNWYRDDGQNRPNRYNSDRGGRYGREGRGYSYFGGDNQRDNRGGFGRGGGGGRGSGGRGGGYR